MKLAHISDLHFSKFGFELNDLISKRLLGNLNLLRRKAQFSQAQREEAIAAFEKEGVTHVLITGDFTTTGSKKEYSQALHFVEKLKMKGWPVFVLPGNHDHYTSRGSKDRIFYRHMEALPLLKEERIAFYDLDPTWRLILLDTTLATPWHLSTGLFSEKTEESLKKILDISQDKKVILANHFPFFQHEAPNRRLLRGEALGALIKKSPQIAFYLHGHTHRPTAADLRKNGWPVVIDSGSLPHTERGGWSLLELSSPQWTATQFLHTQGLWTKTGLIRE